MFAIVVEQSCVCLRKLPPSSVRRRTISSSPGEGPVGWGPPRSIEVRRTRRHRGYGVNTSNGPGLERSARWSSGFADGEVWVDEVDLWVNFAGLDAGDQEFGGEFADFAERLTNGGQGGAGPFGAADVVEADDTEVFGNADAKVLGGAQDDDGDRVVSGEDRGGWRRAVEKLSGVIVGSVAVVMGGSDVVAEDFDAGFIEGVEEGEAADVGGDEVFVAADVGDAFV